LIAPDTVPVRSDVGFAEEESGVVILMPRYPTFAGRLMGKLLHRSTHVRLKLDSLGSAVWRLIDGRRDVRQIGEQINSVFGDVAEPVYPRLVEFLNILLRNKFVKLTELCEVSNVD